MAHFCGSCETPLADETSGYCTKCGAAVAAPPTSRIAITPKGETSSYKKVFFAVIASVLFLVAALWIAGWLRSTRNSPATDSAQSSAADPKRNNFTFNQNINLLVPRNDEQERLNAINYFHENLLHFHCGESGCDNSTLFVDNESEGAFLPGRRYTPSQLKGLEGMSTWWSDSEKDEFVCMLARAEFQQSIFDSVLINATDTVGVANKFQATILLPVKVPASCKLPPDTSGFR